MTQTEERAVLERAAKVCEEYLQGPMPATTAFLYLPNKIRSLPLESKESEEGSLPEGCLWAVTKGGRTICQPPRRGEPCPKCAESEQASLGSLHYAGGLLKRAEAAEARADKWQSAYTKEFDIRNGTPGEQIRWQEVLDDTRENLANVQVQLDDCGALARRLTYALKRSHTNEELCKQSVDLLKRLGQGGQIVRAK